MSSTKRTKGITIVRPIVYGNVATLLPQKKAPESDHTHKWTVSNPPFEITETGWGEFELSIKLQFVPESGEKHVTLYHNLRLHPYEEDGSISTANKNKPVQSFLYDELVFTDPTEAMYQILTSHPYSSLPAKSTPNSLYTEQEEISKIEDAYKKVQEQIQTHRSKLDSTTKELDEIKSALERLKK
ncbi:6691_t:CDS:2 [Entrophospora sp. SA101]|nr:5563_t:CDS:2 [Entrophospora candida]CAJ0633447.1 6691_t:CDS:2 [Entrophospora sp. SA101]CAJ0839506.1 13254_t:CDS:2 [Entrophospora sp. SA101]CAJ0891688.1 13080_t:CDS:2 [Entrophospora sp. SA101]CAJ0891908.1 13098_t:CDS:2 [Entrophospora sp. SA101]